MAMVRGEGLGRGIEATEDRQADIQLLVAPHRFGARIEMQQPYRLLDGDVSQRRAKGMLIFHRAIDEILEQADGRVAHDRAGAAHSIPYASSARLRL